MVVKAQKIIVVALTGFFLTIFFVSPVRAQSPSLSFYPESGIIKDVDEGFTVDVLLDSGEEELVKTRMVFTFDPSQIQITKASRNNSLFQQWPDDESTLDNENGVVMLTGFTQSGSGQLYKTSEEADVLARIEFEIITDDTQAEIPLEWEFTGSDELFQSVLVADGSPPQNVLETRPTDGLYAIGELTQTAIDPRYIPFIISGLLILIAGVIISSKPEFTRKKYGTVVVYDE